MPDSAYVRDCECACHIFISLALLKYRTHRSGVLYYRFSIIKDHIPKHGQHMVSDNTHFCILVKS